MTRPTHPHAKIKTKTETDPYKDALTKGIAKHTEEATKMLANAEARQAALAIVMSERREEENVPLADVDEREQRLSAEDYETWLLFAQKMNQVATAREVCAYMGLPTEVVDQAFGSTLEGALSDSAVLGEIKVPKNTPAPAGYVATGRRKRQ